MDAHQNEYAGAVAGFRESAGWKDTTNTTPSVGDFVSGLTAGRRWSGHIEWFSDDDATVVVNVNHSWERFPVADITH